MRKNIIRIVHCVLVLIMASAGIFACGGSDVDPVAETGPGPSEQDQASELFDTERMISVEIEMDSDDWVSLYNDSRFGAGLSLDEVFKIFDSIAGSCDEPWPDEYTWFKADITVNGETLEQVGVRRKGFIGSLYAPVPPMKIKTDKYVEGQFLGDTERITLNNGGGYLTTVRSCLTFEIFAEAGLPAPRCNLANVRVNGEHLGAYTHVDAIKKRFLEYAFGDSSGSLYEGTGADFGEDWLTRWEVKTDDTDPDHGPILAIADALQAPDEELVAALSPVLNIQRYITFWALEVITNHGDGYSSDRNNFYVYFDPTDSNRAVFIPWGVDKALAYEYSPSLKNFLTAELPRRLSRIPAMAEAMANELERISTEVWDIDAILESMGTYYAQLDATGGGDLPALQSLRAWVEDRPEAIAALLEAGLPAGASTGNRCGE